MRRLLLFLLFPSLSFAQGFFASPQLALKTVNGLTSPLAGATITVCAKNTGGIPCSPALASTIFSDSALTQALSNPFTADSNGNYIFAAAPGQYTVTVTGTGFSGYSSQVSVGPAMTAAGTFTTAQHFYVSSQVGTTTAGAWWTATQGGGVEDAVNGIVTIPVGSTVHQADGVSGNCGTAATSSPLGVNNNCVGVYGAGRNQGNGTAAWGGNFSVGDAVGYTGTLIIGHEVDVGMSNSSVPTRFQGFFLTGNSLIGTMPSGPVMGTLNIASNSASAYGVAFPNGAQQFPVAFWSARGTAPVGLMLDASCYTGACNSQQIQLGANNGTTALTGTIQVDQIGDIFTTSTGTGVGWGFPTYNFSQLNASAPNGVMTYCTNCKNVVDDAAVAGAACITGGHGAYAKRENSRWDCN